MYRERERYMYNFMYHSKNTPIHEGKQASASKNTRWKKQVSP